MIMFRMRYTKHGKTGKTPPMLFPNHLIRLVDYFAQTSMSYFKAQNIACMGQDPMFQKGTGGAIVMKNIYTQVDKVDNQEYLDDGISRETKHEVNGFQKDSSI